MRTRAATMVLVLAVLASSLAVGCQRGEGGGGDGGGQRIGLLISTLNKPFFLSLRDGAQQAADEAGVELIVSDAQNDAATQQDDVQNFVTQQVDAILVNPVDSEAVVPAVQAANQADIPVIALDRGASGGEIATLIASDNVEGGRLAGEELIELVGSGPVAQLEGIPGASPTRDRGQGFEEAINALGAVRALGNRAGTDVKIVGFDAVEDALKAIQDGKMNATVAQQPDRIGSLGVENAMKVIEGESVDENIPVPVKLVTEENVSEFLQ